MCYFHLLFFTSPNRLYGLPWWLSGKESTCQCRRRGFDPRVEKIQGNPLQYSGLGNPMDRGAWWARVHRVAKCWIGMK